ELLAGKQLQPLAENAGYSYHGGGGPPYDSRLATQTVAEFYPRRSKPNLDKSEYFSLVIFFDGHTVLSNLATGQPQTCSNVKMHWLAIVVLASKKSALRWLIHLGGRDSLCASAAVSNCAHAFGRRRHAVPNQEVSDRAGRGARRSVRHPGLSRVPLRAAHCKVFRAVLLARAYRPDRFLSAGRTVRAVRVQTQAEGREGCSSEG